MPKTEVRSGQILNATVGRSDVNIATPGEAITTKIVAGTGVSISSTGADTGTGDVTITATGGAGGAHHATHEPGGADALVNAAWTNVANVFTQPQTIQRDYPGLVQSHSLAPANQRAWQLTTDGGSYQVQTMTDAGAFVSTPLTLNRAGDATISNNLTVIGAGGNVACKDQANIFTQDQTLSYSIPIITLNATAADADARRFDIVNLGSGLQFQAKSDAGVTQATPFSIGRTGAYVGGNLDVVTDITARCVVSMAPHPAATYGGLHSQGSYAECRLVETTYPANSQMFRLLGFQGKFQIWAANDATGAQAVSLQLDRTGNMQICPVATSNRLQFGAGTNATPALRYTGARLECVLGDNSNWAGITALNFVSVGTGNNFSDLTVSGAVSVGTTVSVGGSVTITGGLLAYGGVNSQSNTFSLGYIQSKGVIYPGRIDVGGGLEQLSWYLGSHGSYGLYCNTGLAIAGSYWELGRSTQMGYWIAWSPVFYTEPGHAIGGTITAAYCLVGKMLYWYIYCVNFNNPVVTNYLRCSVPIAASTNIVSAGIRIYIPGIGDRFGFTAFEPDVNWLSFRRGDGGTTWPVGVGHIIGQGFYPIG